MTVSPQSGSPSPAYPSHRNLAPLQTAVLAGLACAVSSCHTDNLETRPQQKEQPRHEEKATPKRVQKTAKPAPVLPEQAKATVVEGPEEKEEAIQINAQEINRILNEEVEGMHIKGLIMIEGNGLHLTAPGREEKSNPRGTIIEI